MLSMKSFGSVAIQASKGSSIPNSANSATQSTWIIITSASFWAWNRVRALSWNPVKGESTMVKVMSGLSFSKAAFSSFMCFSPTSVPRNSFHRTSALAAQTAVGTIATTTAIRRAETDSLRMMCDIG